MANALKFIITGIPLLIFVLWAASPQKFREGLAAVDSVQGPGGWVVINKKDQPTFGMSLQKFLEGMAPNASNNVKTYFQSVSTDVDRIAYFIQNQWVWCAAGLTFVICLVVILRAKDYK